MGSNHTEYTERFLLLMNNNSAAMLSNQDRETDPALNFAPKGAKPGTRK